MRLFNSGRRNAGAAALYCEVLNNVAQFSERNMKWLFTSVGALVVSSGLAQAVLAEPQEGQCTGILHRDKTGLKFGGGDEGICIIKKDDESRILTACTVGRYCMVIGQVDPCTDSGECVEITNISAVSSNAR
jgi:hypothetical protein